MWLKSFQTDALHPLILLHSLCVCSELNIPRLITDPFSAVEVFVNEWSDDKGLTGPLPHTDWWLNLFPWGRPGYQWPRNNGNWLGQALASSSIAMLHAYRPALDTQPSSLTPSLIMADNKSMAVTTHSFSHAVNGLRVTLWPLRSATITPHSPISSGQRNNDLCKCWIALMKDITWYSRLAKYVLITKPRFCRWRLFSIFRTDFIGTVVEYFGSDL